MKKKNFMVLMMVLAFLVGSVGLVMGADSATATDEVGVSYTSSGQFVLLRMLNNNQIADISYNLGTWTAATAGAQAQSGGAATGAASSGYLQYTLYGYTEASYEITIAADTGGLLEAVVAEGSVKDAGNDDSVVITNGGGDPGDAVHTGLDSSYPGSGNTVPIGTNATDFITGITSVNTWTGTGNEDGAQVVYYLVADPGTTKSVTVTYTLQAAT
jgi:hypothetical protein